MSDIDLASQFNGPYSQDLMAAIQGEIDLRDPVISYLLNLSINTAGPTELATIGGIIGYPWPNAPSGTFDSNNFVFGSAATFPTISGLNGFAGVSSPGVGGQFVSATPAVGNLIPIAFYRLLLTQVAFLKANGLSYVALDQICHIFGPLYTFSNPLLVGDLFQLGDAASFPTLSAMHGLSGTSPPYLGTEGGLLSSAISGGISDSDIYITFQTNIGPGYLWLIQNLFNRFTTAPQIFVIQGGI